MAVNCSSSCIAFCFVVGFSEAWTLIRPTFSVRQENILWLCSSVGGRILARGNLFGGESALFHSDRLRLHAIANLPNFGRCLVLVARTPIPNLVLAATSPVSRSCEHGLLPTSHIMGKEAASVCFRPASDRSRAVDQFGSYTGSDRCSELDQLRQIQVRPEQEVEPMSAGLF